MLIEADHVSSRVAEPRRDLGRIRADRLHNFTAQGDNRLKSRGHAIDHNVNEKAGRRGGRAPEHPGAAYFAGRIVKGGAAVTSLPDAPLEDLLVEFGGVRNVGGRNLDVADLAVTNRGHQYSFRASSL